MSSPRRDVTRNLSAGEMVAQVVGAARDRKDAAYLRYELTAIGYHLVERPGGFDALVPQPRKTGPASDTELLDLAVRLKRENPARTATHIVEMIVTDLTGRGDGRDVPSVRTVQRHFARLGLNVRPDGRPAETFGRFEAAKVNDLWVGDVAHGPRVAGGKALLFAFLDDHSRLVTGHRWGRSEDVLRLEAALRRGLAARGVPKRIYVDNGSPFVSHQLQRICAVLGVRLVHSRPGRPQGRGKIERFFATVRAQFLVEIADDQLTSLEELNRLFTAWVEARYHHRPHRETKQTPLERFTAAGIPEVPGPELLREAFLWAETRTVTKTAMISLHGNHYEVDPALVGRRVQLVFDPFDLEHLEIRYDDALVTAEIFLKLENLQPVGSFKIRGASNALALAPPDRLERGVWTASAGNMGQGVAWQARRLGLQCTVVVPDHAPEIKLAALERLGARVVRTPFADWFEILRTCTFPGMDGHFVHPVSDPNVMAGNGTIGLEILEDLPDVETIVVPYGGGGLSCGIASAVRALEPTVRVLAAEVETAAPLAPSLAAGSPQRVTYTASFVDGIGSPFLLPEIWPLAQRLLDGSLTTPLADVAAAVRLLLERNRIVAEGAGATPVAAALSGAAGGGRVVCVVSGGNLDPSRLARILMGELP